MYVNGEYFDWGHGSVKLGTRTLVDFDEITDFGDQVSRKARYGKGRQARGFTTQRYEPKQPSISMAVEEWLLILNDPEVKQKGIYRTQFSLTVTLDKGSGAIYEGTLDQCLFADRSLDGFKENTDGMIRKVKLFTYGTLVENGQRPFGDGEG